MSNIKKYNLSYKNLIDLFNRDLVDNADNIDNEYTRKFDWWYISENQTLSEDFIRKFQNSVDWVEISKKQTLSEDFIREFQNKVDWRCISKYQILSENFIRDFHAKVDWFYISAYQHLSEDFIRGRKNFVDWTCISKHKMLSESFIREFADRVDWYNISKNQILSENFIKEFHDKVDWIEISQHQTLSDDFIIKFHEKVSLNIIKQHKNIKISFSKIRANHIIDDMEMSKSFKKRAELVRERDACNKFKLESNNKDCKINEITLISETLSELSFISDKNIDKFNNACIDILDTHIQELDEEIFNISKYIEHQLNTSIYIYTNK